MAYTPQLIVTACNTIELDTSERRTHMRELKSCLVVFLLFLCLEEARLVSFQRLHTSNAPSFGIRMVHASSRCYTLLQTESRVWDAAIVSYTDH